MKFRAYYQKVSDGKFIIEGEYSMADLTDKGILFDQERIKWVQYTGLKDCQGREIYEGDILRTLNYFDYTEENKPVYLHHKVIYETERGTYNAINVTNVSESLTTIGNCFLYVALKDPTIEVIGDIYTTPELLKP